MALNMTRKLAVLLVLAASALRGADPVPPPSDPQARKWVEALRMSYLPKESGFLALISTSALQAPYDGRIQPLQGQIYYMLTRELPVNYLHWLAPDDTHIHPDGRVDKFTLGRDVARGQVLVVPVPGGCWKALRLHPGAGYALMANVLSPDWSPENVRIGAGAAWIAKYRGAAPWATADFLRGLIGPNFQP